MADKRPQTIAKAIDCTLMLAKVNPKVKMEMMNDTFFMMF